MSNGTAARQQLGVLSIAIVLSMAPWFAATVVADPMSREFSLPSWQVSWLTLAVQLGFVVGSIASAVLLLSDQFSARRLAAGASLLAAAATAGLVLGTPNGWQSIGLRLLTGASLACVYPPGMKIAAGWTQRHRGTAIGILVGAVTVGSAAPHLLRATLGCDAVATGGPDGRGECGTWRRPVRTRGAGGTVSGEVSAIRPEGHRPRAS